MAYPVVYCGNATLLCDVTRTRSTIRLCSRRQSPRLYRCLHNFARFCGTLKFAADIPEDVKMLILTWNG